MDTTAINNSIKRVRASIERQEASLAANKALLAMLEKELTAPKGK